ncbi:MAG: formylglycine-generating enzyme family protein [Pyrinomonadaceae bacterium]
MSINQLTKSSFAGTIGRFSVIVFMLTCIGSVAAFAQAAGTIRKNPNGMEFAYIPAGSFQMGDSNNGPIHAVTISQGFYLGKTEVTQAQWVAVMGRNPSHFKGGNLPVEMVSWVDVQGFIRKLNARGNWTYRLPTEAEWEYAARAGTTGDYAGNVNSMAWFDANSGSKTHTVATKEPNAWGLYDMHGNVWEWTADWFGEYASGSVTDPKGAVTGSRRVQRSGCFHLFDFFSGSAYRNGVDPSARSNDLGFRIAARVK